MKYDKLTLKPGSGVSLYILLVLWQPKEMLNTPVPLHKAVSVILISSVEHFWKSSYLFQMQRLRFCSLCLDL